MFTFRTLALGLLAALALWNLGCGSCHRMTARPCCPPPGAVVPPPPPPGVPG